MHTTRHFIYTRVHDRMLCTQDYKADFIVGVVEAFFTAVFKTVATFNIDFASRDGNRTHQNAFRLCDSNFVRQTIEIGRIKNFDSRLLVSSTKSLAM